MVWKNYLILKGEIIQPDIYPIIPPLCDKVFRYCERHLHIFEMLFVSLMPSVFFFLQDTLNNSQKCFNQMEWICESKKCNKKDQKTVRQTPLLIIIKKYVWQNIKRWHFMWLLIAEELFFHLMFILALWSKPFITTAEWVHAALLTLPNILFVR